MTFARLFLCLLFILSGISALPLQSLNAGEITGSIIDATTGEVIPARLSVSSADGKTWYLAKSEGRAGLGAAIPYEKRRGEQSIEVHTALSADPFRIEDLPPGRYRLTATRGHEYRAATLEVELPESGKLDQPAELKLDRWIHLAERGWFSGDVHCHLPVEGLKTVLLAADLNVTFPLAGWVTDTAHKPSENNKLKDAWPRPNLQFADNTHVFWPANTEYELFTREGEKHPLGALLAIHHREPLDLAVPPVGPMVEHARKQGALFDLDKHNWPWSMMLPAIGAADLFELTNNHVWETAFGVTNWYTEYIPSYMNIPVSEDGKIDERGWLDFGFQNWYALLNCGIRIAPSAGTGSGVHPVALGFGRVYVRMPEREFDFDDWMAGLKLGRSFVTTGPMLFLTANEKHPGSTVAWNPKSDEAKSSEEEGDGVPVIVRVESELPIESMQLVVNGDLIPLEIGGSIGAKAAHSAMARVRVKIERSSWIAARVFTQTADGRPRFAHTAPVWVEVEGKPLRPKILEANYLLGRVEAEIERNKEVLSKEALAEFEKAAEFYREQKDRAIEAE